ncbi:MAG: Na/Pi cotransporter family protein [Spirochaetota bacterium]|nr:Na/Pi cotransporter family protein [Spirochaetota bacterium]
MNGYLTTVTILGGLGLFLYGMRVLSESLQIATGDRLRNILRKATDNRIAGLLTGTSITGIIQSSSATTVMLVSFVNAGLIDLQQSLGIMLGANIGTTLTGWVVAVFGFKIKIISFALPAIALGFIFRFQKRENLKNWGEVLFGFGILFIGLNFMTGAVKELRGSEMVLNVLSTYKADTLLSTLVVILIGTLVTMGLQSSSATMAMTMTLAVNGLIDFPTSCALVLGENLGTTITAHLASIGASLNAKRCAMAHVIFNFFGIIWVLFLFKWLFIPMIDFIIPGDPFASDITIKSITIADHLAAFHTAFNVINALIFLPLLHFLTWITIKFVPKKNDNDGDETFHLKYISTPVLATPSINIDQARLEINRMAELIIKMFDKVMDVFMNPCKKLGAIVEEIQNKENTVDLLEKEISSFLVRVSQHNISQEQSHEISSMLHIVNELERIGDHCEILLKLIRRKYDSRLELSETAVNEILEISGKVREILELISNNISKSHVNILPKASVIEDRIDELRKEMRKGHIKRLNEGLCDVNSGLLFIDMLTSFEKIGDHSFNVAEGISGERIF